MTVWGSALGNSNTSILFHEHFASLYTCLWFLLQSWIVCLASRKGDTDIWGAVCKFFSRLFSLRIKSDSYIKGFARSLPVPDWNCHSLCRMKWQHGGNAQAVTRQSLDTALEGKRNSTPELSPPERPQPWPLYPQESSSAAKGQATEPKGLDIN